uniref:DNA/RNA-binding domain-containing protein n=2 Tax=Kalanchoe fedtschenkoi TaxID=63787 RepID=A0A7N0URA0_KALFE
MCVRGSLKLLLSSGSEEKLNFGKDAMENGLIIVRLVAILIFSSHNAKKEIDGPTYAEILQREVLIEKAFTAVFDFMGHIMSRCKELQDVSSSCLLPGILVFMEWLASCPDVVSDTDVNDKHAEERFTFWNDFVTFLNKLLSDGLVSTDDEDETCFFNMSTYEESENENRFALWEDFELRGFLPLTPAQNILDFSRKHSSGSNKEKKARVQRIFAAGKVLANIVKFGQKSICFDSTMKRFSAGVESPLSGDKPKLSNQDALHNVAMEKVVAKGMLQPNGQLFSEVEGDEEDEVIVFKPTVSDKVNNAVDPSSAPVGRVVHETYAVGGVALSSSGHIPVSQPCSHNHGQVEFQTVVQPPISLQISGNFPQYHEPIQSLSWSAEQLANGLKGLGFMGNGPRIDVRRQADVGMSYPLPSRLHQVADSNTNRAIYGHSNAPESFIPLSVGTPVSSGPRADAFSVKTAVTFPEGSRKSPISRPHRHLGPPPGFNSVPRKQMSDSISVQSSETKSIDEYSWLNGHRIPVPMSMSSTGLHNNVPVQVNSQANDVNGNMFPFSGNQVSRLQSHLQQNHTSFEHMDQKVVQYQYQQQLAQAQLQNQHHGISKWPGQNLV